MSSGPGTFVLSLDTEIAWGTFDHGGLVRYARHFDQIRPVVHQLIALLDRYEIPATWAFVGHLLLDHCRPGPEGLTHSEVLRPRYAWYPHDWHHCDPGTDVSRDPWWYGPDLLDAVLKARVHHEIGTHTFSHVVVDDPACTREIFRSQLQACVDLHRIRGLELRSIVYPRNKIAFLDVLDEFGIVAYRGMPRQRYAAGRSRLIRGVRFLEHALPIPPPTYALPAAPANGPINVPASMFYLPADGIRRVIPVAARARKATLGLQQAADRGELFHLWFHPFNLGSDPRLFSGLETIFRTAVALRDAGTLNTVTMTDVALQAREAA